MNSEQEEQDAAQEEDVEKEKKTIGRTPDGTSTFNV